MSQVELLTALLIASLAGGVLPLFARDTHRALHLLVCLSAGFFLGVVFLHLMPEMQALSESAGGIWAWALVGLLGVLILDLGIFGHQGHHAVGWATLLGLAVHAAAMGLSLGVLEHVTGAFAVAMLAHKFGESFSLMSAMRFSVTKRRSLLSVLVVFSIVTPATMLVGGAMLAATGSRVVPLVTAIAAGSFLYVAVGDLLPEVFHEAEDRLLKIVLLLVGVGFAALVCVGHEHGHLADAGEHAHETVPPLVTWLGEFWHYFRIAAPFLLLGFAVAALVRAFVPATWMSRLLGGNDVKSVLTASAIGAPLPLCSCSVLPTALSLRKRGASKPATVAFLVSTPETGIDSIAISAALLDPYLTVARPVGALCSATVAGLATALIAGDTTDDAAELEVDCDHCATGEEPAAEDRSLRAALRFAFVDLADDILPSLLAGIALSALLAVFLPANLLATPWASGFGGIVLAALVGVPIYVCASASTPIAAALMLKGLSPGAALVFLLVGPATNLASVVVLRKALGSRVVAVYLSAVVAVALGLGVLMNTVYGWIRVVPVARVGAHEGEGLLGTAAAVVLAVLCGIAILRKGYLGRVIG